MDIARARKAGVSEKEIQATVQKALKNLPNMSHEDVDMVDNGQPGETEPAEPAIAAPIAKKTYKHDGFVVLFGFGGVAECTLPVLLKHLDIEPSQIIILDMLDKSDVLKNWIDEGVTFIQHHITEENFTETMDTYLDSGDILIDVCYDVACIEVVKYCKVHDIYYINTSVEEWCFTDGFDSRTPYDKSLYARHQEIYDEIDSWGDNEGCTAILNMGANPGLISHFMKQGLLDLAKAKKIKTDILAARNDYASIAEALGVKVVLDTERDTQIAIRPKEVDEFVGTWSVLGLVEEATSPVEMGWGTHESKLPEHATVPRVGPKNQIFLSQMGIHTLCRAFVPADPKDIVTEGEERTDGYEIVGNNIRHAEADTISEFLTTEDGKYRPTVYYCYCPSDSTVASMREFAANNYCNDNERKPYRQRVLYENDILSGADILGIMFGGYDDKHVWWCGSSLNIEDVRILCPLQNATTVQVAIGVVSGICWMLENPKRGVVQPEDLDTDFILKLAKPYLGTFISKEFEWSPAKNYVNSYEERKDANIDKNNLWGFQNFLVRNC